MYYILYLYIYIYIYIDIFGLFHFVGLVLFSVFLAVLYPEMNPSQIVRYDRRPIQ